MMFKTRPIKNTRPTIRRNAKVSADGGPVIKFKKTGTYRLEKPWSYVK